MWFIDKLGREKFGALCTDQCLDNAMNMRLAKSIVIAMEDVTHILKARYHHTFVSFSSTDSKKQVGGVSPLC